MKYVLTIVFLVIGMGIFLWLSTSGKDDTVVPVGGQNGTQSDQNLPAQEGNMKITSTAFDDGGSVPSKYTCDGADVSPPLQFENVPDDTSSLVLIVDDPDAPAKTWVHWVVYDISPETTGIDEDSVPEGAKEGVTDFGEPGYGGPCPPSGTHGYHFKLYALDVPELSLPEGDSKDRVEEAMTNHIIDQAEMVVSYTRE